MDINSGTLLKTTITSGYFTVKGSQFLFYGHIKVLVGIVITRNLVFRTCGGCC